MAAYRNHNDFLGRLRLEAENLTLLRIDISNWRDFATLPPHVDAVVHIAGVSTAAGVSIDDMLAVNVTGARNVQRYAVRAGVRKFIYASSLSIHGRIETDVVDEHTPINDPEPYGATKYLGERMLASVADTIPTVAIRLPGVLGSGAHRAWIPSVVETLVAGKEVSIYNPNAGFNNAVHVSDLSKFVTTILLGQGWRGFSAFPVGASGKMTILEVVHLLRETLGSASKLCENNIIKPSFLIDSTCAVQCFGYVPTPIDVLLMRYLEDLL
jgi:UDP-glucose 4-epimerase